MKWRASIRSPSAVTTPAARPGSPATGCTAICVSSMSVRTSPPALSDGGDEGFGQPGRATDAHLRLAAGGQQRWDVVAKAGRTRIDFAQAVEEQEASLHCGTLELAQHELAWRAGACF